MNARSQAAFTEGSVLRHVLVMTATGSVGLVAVFAVDALNLFYISRLGVAELAAAVGFAGIVMFMTTSFAIGLTVATSALTARAIGQRDRERAAMLGGTSLLLTLAVSTVVAAALFPFLRPMLQLLGATGTTLDLATFFMQIVLPSGPALAVGMAASGILRAAGDARRAMYVTLGAALAAAIFDPILIFLLDLRLTGAAISTVISRLVLLAIGFHGASFVHRLVATPNRETLSLSVRPFFAIAFPAILTQLATPFGNTFVTRSIAGFGDAAVAGWAIIGRVVAVAFGAVFALSGAVGPVIGQNVGAGLPERVRETLAAALKLTAAYTIGVWALMALMSGPIADLFRAEHDARALIVFFCIWVAGSFLFTGALFVANAAFNNLGHATLSTVFNWGRATIGTIPFAIAGAWLGGAEGVVAGWGLGAVVFGVAAAVVAFRKVDQLAGGAKGG